MEEIERQGEPQMEIDEQLLDDINWLSSTINILKLSYFRTLFGKQLENRNRLMIVSIKDPQEGI